HDLVLHPFPTRRSSDLWHASSYPPPMGKRSKKNDTALIGLLVIVGLPIMAIVALYEAIGPYAFFGSIIALVVGYVWHQVHRAKRSEEHTSELQSRFDLV